MTVTLVETDVETRSGDGYQVADVNLPKRIVTVVAMPYEKPTEIFEAGRVFTEVVSRGAFDGVEKRTRKILANRGHSWDKVAGKVVGLHPSRKEGLVADVFMFGTAIGEETLVLCDQGGLDASAGFLLLRRADGRVHEDAETWERNRTVRRLNRLRLDHLAFVPNPAYEDAVVLDVRARERAQSVSAAIGTVEATPNLDRVLIDAQKAQRAELDRRWIL